MRTLLDERRAAGEHSAVVNGAGLASGLYFLRLEAGDGQIVRKCLLLK